VIGRIDGWGDVEMDDRQRRRRRVERRLCGVRSLPTRKFFAASPPPVTDLAHGGYAEYMIAPSRRSPRVPDGLSATDAAPLLCRV